MMYAQLDRDVTVSDDSGDKTVPAGTPCEVVILGERNDVCMESPDGWLLTVSMDDCTPLETEDACIVRGYNAR